MARARNIKPGFFKNEQLVELGYDRRLLFIGLWTLADREGRLEDRPKHIKMEIFPADDVNVDKALEELQVVDLILRYEVGQKRYIQILTFLKHQNPHHREPPSTIPKPEALPPLQPGKSPRLEADCNIPKPEALPSSQPHEAPDKPSTRPSSAVLIPSSLIPDSGFPSKARTPRKRETPIPEDFSVSDRVRAWAQEKGHGRLERYLEFFVGRMRANGKKYLDWDEAFMNCIREDWPEFHKDNGKAGPVDPPKIKCAACGKPIQGGWTGVSGGRMHDACYERKDEFPLTDHDLGVRTT